MIVGTAEFYYSNANKILDEKVVMQFDYIGY